MYRFFKQSKITWQVKLFDMLVFAALFTIIGSGLPYFYNQYLDTTVYYELQQPITLDRKTYKPCDSQVVTALRSAKINLRVHIIKQLFKVTSDSKGIQKPILITNATTDRQSGIEKSLNTTVNAIYKLPCDLEPGIYFWKIAATYNVSGREHTEIVVTETFNVTDRGSVNVQNTEKQLKGGAQ